MEEEGLSVELIQRFREAMLTTPNEEEQKKKRDEDILYWHRIYRKIYCKKEK